jgi:hypothetical protein
LETERKLKSRKRKVVAFSLRSILIADFLTAFIYVGHLF